MNLWIVLIFIITLMHRIHSYNLSQKWKLIQKELENLKQQFEDSKYSKSKYHSDLKLYTARIDDHTEACTQPIFDCYCDEFEVILEEISMTGEEDLAMEMRDTLENMKTYRPSESDRIDSCKKCEEYEEESFQEFVKSFESMTQKMNSKKPTL